MWLCFNHAFVSAVADRNSDRLVVRARRRQHLQKLFGDGVQISIGAGTDYRHRVVVDRVTLADVVIQVLMSLQYTNFKESVVDQALHNLYGEFWVLHRRMQE
jgi:hypothetical protein